MVGEGVLSMNQCYEHIFIGSALWEAGNRELERPTTVVMK
jgi:hypothetical protein